MDITKPDVRSGYFETLAIENNQTPVPIRSYLTFRIYSDIFSGYRQKESFSDIGLLTNSIIWKSIFALKHEKTKFTVRMLCTSPNWLLRFSAFFRDSAWQKNKCQPFRYDLYVPNEARDISLWGIDPLADALLWHRRYQNFSCILSQKNSPVSFLSYQVLGKFYGRHAAWR
jgi:hypothetical protein